MIVNLKENLLQLNCPLFTEMPSLLVIREPSPLWRLVGA